MHGLVDCLDPHGRTPCRFNLTKSEKEDWVETMGLRLRRIFQHVAKEKISRGGQDWAPRPRTKTTFVILVIARWAQSWLPSPRRQSWAAWFKKLGLKPLEKGECDAIEDDEDSQDLLGPLMEVLVNRFWPTSGSRGRGPNWPRLPAAEVVARNILIRGPSPWP